MVKIRRKIMDQLGKDFPPTARLILEWAMAQGKSQSSLWFSVPDLPPTVNRLYRFDRHAGNGTPRVTQEVKDFKHLVAVSIGSSRATWKPTGAVMVVIFCQSPHWITKRDTIRDMDGDNRVKVLFDAIQDCTGVRDFTNWEFHFYKVASGQVKTSVFLFDLGDVIPYFPS